MRLLEVLLYCTKVNYVGWHLAARERAQSSGRGVHVRHGARAAELQWLPAQHAIIGNFIALPVSSPKPRTIPHNHSSPWLPGEELHWLRPRPMALSALEFFQF